jgi:hypothetical protein
MEIPMVTKEKVVKAIDELPPEQLLEVDRFIEFLQFKARQTPRVQGQESDSDERQEEWRAALAATFGLWADRSDIAPDGIAYVREMRRGHRLHDFWEQIDESD